MVHIYSITQKDNKNNWLFECKEHKVLPHEKAWRAIFLKSLGTDFDFDKRWLDMLQLTDTDVASTSAKKRSLPGKRNLPNARNYKGGKKQMSKNKVIFDKAAKEEKRKQIAEKFPKIDFVQALNNGPGHHYVRYKTHVRSGEEWSEELGDPEMLRLKTCHSQILRSGDRSCNKVVKLISAMHLINILLMFSLIK